MKGNKDILGIFDSGIGGFSVFKEIRKNTDADILYFGDCLRAPYGNRKEEEIISFIKEIIMTLKEKGVSHFVSACNSMSVLTTKNLLKEVGIAEERYIDMTMAIKKISFQEDTHVLIVGTKATIASSVYQSILLEKSIRFQVFTPYLLAGYIEQGDVDAITLLVDQVILFARDIQATHIVYACTHYPLVDGIFKARALFLGWDGSFIDPAVYVAEIVKHWNLQGSHLSTFMTSLETPIFKEYQKRMEML